MKFRNGTSEFYNADLSSAMRHIDWQAFKESLENMYSKRYASAIYGYCQQYGSMLSGNFLAKLNGFSKAKRRMILASLIALSKHLGCYEAFKRRIHDFGIKWQGQDGTESMLRILKD